MSYYEGTDEWRENNGQFIPLISNFLDPGVGYISEEIASKPKRIFVYGYPFYEEDLAELHRSLQEGQDRMQENTAKEEY